MIIKILKIQTLPKVMHPRWQVAELELNLPSILDFSAHALPTISLPCMVEPRVYGANLIHSHLVCSDVLSCLSSLCVLTEGWEDFPQFWSILKSKFCSFNAFLPSLTSLTSNLTPPRVSPTI